jgi:hypothetical protein
VANRCRIHATVACGSARTTRATFIALKPRQQINPILLPGVCALLETGNGPMSGSSEFRVGMPGTNPSRSADSARTMSMTPDPAIK